MVGQDKPAMDSCFKHVSRGCTYTMYTYTQFMYPEYMYMYTSTESVQCTHCITGAHQIKESSQH